jgi:hypothetical protein
LKIYFEGLLSEKFLENLTLESKNFGFTAVGNIINCDIRVVVDPKEIVIPSRDIIILSEPEVVRPDLYRKKFIHGQYKILPLGRYRAERLKLKHWINFPVELPNYKKTILERKKQFALINEHKFSSSRRSNYGLRRKTLLYFESSDKFKLDLFGNEWNVSKDIELRRRIYQIKNKKNYISVDLIEVFSDLWKTYSSLTGHMHQDCEALQNYEVNICIENDSDYVSEKVWKALYAGAVPLYVGPKLNFDLDLRESVIYSNPKIEDIINIIESINPNAIAEKRSIANDFLNSSKFKDYSVESTVKHFYSQLTQIL